MRFLIQRQATWVIAAMGVVVGGSWAAHAEPDPAKLRAKAEQAMQEKKEKREAAKAAAAATPAPSPTPGTYEPKVVYSFECPAPWEISCPDPAVNCVNANLATEWGSYGRSATSFNKAIVATVGQSVGLVIPGFKMVNTSKYDLTCAYKIDFQRPEVIWGFKKTTPVNYVSCRVSSTNRGFECLN